MHKLYRAGIIPPECLSKYNYLYQTWDNVCTEDKKQIRERLIEMQGLRCAYCEGPVYARHLEEEPIYINIHIEHFRRKNIRHFPSLTFEWSNLFLSCESHEHCGHYKDRNGGPGYNPDDLVKPDEHDPDRYFYFHSSGEIRIRSNISAEDKKRADETIKVFHLDCSILTGARRRAIRRYERENPSILDAIMSFDEHDAQQFIIEEIESTKNNPYSTVIRHYFEKI